MKKFLVVLCLLISGIMNGQEIYNFYLEPGTSNDEAILHTSFYFNQGAGHIESNLDIVGNTINFSICYVLSSTQSETYDDQEFLIYLPSGYPDFDLNVTLSIFDVNTGECDYLNVFDSGTIYFDYPYTATEKTLVPDDTFEAFLEFIGFGDDIPNNNNVFTHKYENLSRLDMDYIDIQALGPRITDLTGIEVLQRLNLLHARDHDLQEFDGTNHPNLKVLGIVNEQLGLVDLSLNSELRYLDIGGENLVDLDISANTILRTLYINDGPNISELDLSQHIELVRLEVDGTGISSLDLTNNLQLISFGCFNNVSLSSLIMGNAPDLTAIHCNQNALDLIDVSALVSLENLSANTNILTEINLTSNVNLRTVSLFENSLITLDISSNPNIESMLISNNDLVSLDLRNGNNEILTFILGFENLDLNCVDVDDASSAPYGNWLFSNSIVYSENCALSLEDIDTVQAIIYPNPVHEILTIESREVIETIEVYSILGELITSESGKEQIDFSGYAKGVYFLKINIEKGSVFQKVLKE